MLPSAFGRSNNRNIALLDHRLLIIAAGLVIIALVAILVAAAMAIILAAGMAAGIGLGLAVLAALVMLLLALARLVDGVQDAEIMFGMLEIAFRHHAGTGAGGVAAELQVFFE